MATELIVRHLGLQDYLPAWRAMQHLTELRNNSTADEIWLLEHPPVFTLGRAGKPEHVLNPGPVPVYHIDRGGQVTYHGPGQLVVYLLLDLKRLGLGIRELVDLIEQAIIHLLAEYHINAGARRDAPGVYVDGRKIAALGLRVRRGGSYHGLSLNIDMDLEPFKRINPCGYPGMAVTQVKDLITGGVNSDDELFSHISTDLLPYLTDQLGYAKISTFRDRLLPSFPAAEEINNTARKLDIKL
jgi:lipoyl(octanoyl) transferase